MKIKKYMLKNNISKKGAFMKKAFKLTLVILCMIAIFLFSSDKEAETTKKSSYIVNIIQLITKKDYSSSELDTITFIVRKVAHFTIYFLLGFLLINLFREYCYIDKRIFLILILLCMLYACSDEIHQLFVPGRSGEIRDVFIDTIGSTLGLAFYKKILINLPK